MSDHRWAMVAVAVGVLLVFVGVVVDAFGTLLVPAVAAFAAAGYVYYRAAARGPHGGEDPASDDVASPPEAR